MHSLKNVEGELIEGGDKAEKLGEKWTDSKGQNKVPDEEFIFGELGDGAFFPGDFRVQDVSKKSGDNGTDE